MRNVYDSDGKYSYTKMIYDGHSLVFNYNGQHIRQTCYVFSPIGIAIGKIVLDRICSTKKIEWHYFYKFYYWDDDALRGYIIVPGSYFTCLRNAVDYAISWREANLLEELVI